MKLARLSPSVSLFRGGDLIKKPEHVHTIKFIGILVLCFIAWLFFQFNIHSQEVNRSVAVVEYDLYDPNYAVTRKIVIDGIYSYTYSGKKVFEGILYISNLNMSLDMRTKIIFTGSIGKVAFYDKVGQPITTPIYQIIVDSDSQAAFIILFDQYKHGGSSIQAVFPWKKFICAESMSRDTAIELLTKNMSNQGGSSK